MEFSNKIITKQEKYALISLTLCIFIPSYNYYINEIFMLNLGRGSISAVSYLFLAIVGLYSYKYLSHICVKLVALMGLVLAGMFVSYIIYPGIREAFIAKDYNPLTSALLSLPLISFPMMIFTNYLKNHLTILFDYVRDPSLSLITLAIIDYYWTVIVNGHYFDVQYMSFSYFMLPACCLSFGYGLARKKIIDISVAMAGLLVILVVGSRGCFVCGVIFIVMACVKRYALSLGKMFGLFSVLVVLFMALPYVFTSFSDNVQTYMDDHGATSRTLMMINDGTFEESNSRGNIYKIMTDAISVNPFGYGLMGDRYILSQHGNQGYCHSIVYEFLIDYGLFVGPFLLLLLVASLFIKLKKVIKIDFYYILALFAITGFVKLFFSGSYLVESYFWGLLGILFSNKKVAMISNEKKD